MLLHGMVLFLPQGSIWHAFHHVHCADRKIVACFACWQSNIRSCEQQQSSSETCFNGTWVKFRRCMKSRSAYPWQPRDSSSRANPTMVWAPVSESFAGSRDTASYHMWKQV